MDPRSFGWENEEELVRSNNEIYRTHALFASAGWVGPVEAAPCLHLIVSLGEAPMWRLCMGNGFVDFTSLNNHRKSIKTCASRRFVDAIWTACTLLQDSGMLHYGVPCKWPKNPEWKDSGGCGFRMNWTEYTCPLAALFEIASATRLIEKTRKNMWKIRAIILADFTDAPNAIKWSELPEEEKNGKLVEDKKKRSKKSKPKLKSPRQPKLGNSRGSKKKKKPKRKSKHGQSTMSRAPGYSKTTKERRMANMDSSRVSTSSRITRKSSRSKPKTLKEAESANKVGNYDQTAPYKVRIKVRAMTTQMYDDMIANVEDSLGRQTRAVIRDWMTVCLKRLKRMRPFAAKEDVSLSQWLQTNLKYPNPRYDPKEPKLPPFSQSSTTNIAPISDHTEALWTGETERVNLQSETFVDPQTHSASYERCLATTIKALTELRLVSANHPVPFSQDEQVYVIFVL